MQFMYWIINRLNDVSGFFWSVYLEVIGWPWPFWLAADFFRELHLVFADLAWRFMDFSDWVADISGKVESFFNELDLDQWFKDWKQKILDAWDWWRDRWNWFLRSAADWWSPIKTDVEGWIDKAVEGLDTLKAAWDEFWEDIFPKWTANLAQLASDVGDFFTNTLPNLFDLSAIEEWWKGKFLDVTREISDAFKEAEDFWAGWSDMRDKVIEFFTNPMEWLWTRFTDWFLGPEE